MVEQSRPKRARQEREPVGSVAEETARLVEALGGWAEGLREQHGDGHPDPGHTDPAHTSATDADATDADATATDATDADPVGARQDTGQQGDEGAAAGNTSRCEHCGVSSRAGEALACRLCPVCQGISLLRTVRPETVERLADVAAALSGALRDIAADRFGQPPPNPQPPPPRGQRVQDIVVDDEDDDEDDDDEPGAPPDDAAPRSTRPSGTARSTAPTPASRTRQESTAP